MKRSNLLILLLISFNFTASALTTADTTITLHNGIKLSEVWPPRYPQNETRHMMPVPYLDEKPDIIPINTGRQLFIDDFLIEKTNLQTVHHSPDYYKNNPVLQPDKEWEYNKNGPYAAPFSDGVWYDETVKKYKMWYLTGAGPDKSGLRTAYAESKDGIHWEKPILGLFGKTNIVENTNRDAATIWLDKAETDPKKRYKMFMVKVRSQDNLWPMILKYSSDGIHWSKGVAQSGGIYDRSTVFHNPFLEKWVLSMKGKSPIGRSREYLQHSDEKMMVSLTHRVLHEYEDANIVPWFGADDLEPRHPKFPEIEPQIYNHDAIAYESILLGLFTVWQGPENDVTDELDIQKRNEVLVGYSRDGFHWHRPSHKPFMGVNESDGAWNWGNVQSTGGTPIIKGDSLYFYVSGRRLSEYSWDSYSSTGLAMLRRDGFVSLNSKGNNGELLTRKISFDGNHLFVNANIHKGGQLQVEILDENGNILKGYEKTECIPMKEDSTKFQIQWKNKESLAALKNQPVHFKFYLNKGELYSFWVSPWETGESRGYTAGGGPGLSSTGVDIPVQ